MAAYDAPKAQGLQQTVSSPTAPYGSSSISRIENGHPSSIPPNDESALESWRRYEAICGLALKEMNESQHRSNQSFLAQANMSRSPSQSIPPIKSLSTSAGTARPRHMVSMPANVDSQDSAERSNYAIPLLTESVLGEAQAQAQSPGSGALLDLPNDEYAHRGAVLSELERSTPPDQQHTPQTDGRNIIARARETRSPSFPPPPDLPEMRISWPPSPRDPSPPFPPDYLPPSPTNLWSQSPGAVTPLNPTLSSLDALPEMRPQPQSTHSQNLRLNGVFRRELLSINLDIPPLPPGAHTRGNERHLVRHDQQGRLVRYHRSLHNFSTGDRPAQ